ncbi:hypothetical protein FPSE_02513 [Fusarium pseudograminearum CS3096]|uniref:Uncharacterized protein n=1 Tax=Fusarium pseudograminearum (strain CS3096) TaxID=1028729 RepID=K3VT52_FUSPC|nr:hypothetical protein FPSE_02513 [Fusarium pseudograminearum CS3096]EKJ77238.1 hypothetical protein FPSE_02513 [Fusarium pseudograminearum CS3096]
MSPYCLGHELMVCLAVLPQHGKLFHPWISCIGLVPAVLCEISKVDDATLISADQDPSRVQVKCSTQVQAPNRSSVLMKERLIATTQASSSHRDRALMRGGLEMGAESLAVLPNAREPADCGKPLQLGVYMAIVSH